MQKPEKIPFDTFFESMEIFLNFPEVEESISAQVDKEATQILLTESVNDEQSKEEALFQYLMGSSDVEKRLRAVLGLTVGSLERMKRISRAMFEEASWQAIKRDESKIREIAKLLIDPTSFDTFIPKFIQKNIILPQNWQDLLRDEKYVTGIASRDLLSQYSVKVGKALENRIRKIAEEAGYSGVESKVKSAGYKSVDCAIPDAENPRVLVMSSYNLTTASSQTMRANEQSGMYNDIETQNRKDMHQGQKPIYFVNVIDGGGWIERKKDLEKMWSHCHYCFSLKTLDGLKEVLDFAFSDGKPS